MAIKVFKPTINSRRNMSVTDFSVLSKVAPEKSLLAPLNKKSGRNSYGRITVRHRGGGNRRKYRIIDFKRQKFDVEGTVKTLEYDPNRSAFIALIEYTDGDKAYIIAPEGLKVGDKVTAGENADIKPGNALPLTAIPVGTFIHNVELYPGRGAQLARSAGNMAQLMAKENGLALLRLPSGELRNVPESCMATIGQVGNVDHHWVSIRLVKIRITMIATNISISRCLEISELTFVTINTLPGVPSRKVKSICFTYFSSSL